MKRKTTRLEMAESRYCDQLHEWLNNPQNEDKSSEIVESKIAVAFDEYVQALLLDEGECADFISTGGRMGELEFLKIVFDHFKSKRIAEAITSNCELAFTHAFSTESQELEEDRRKLIAYMEQYFKTSEYV